MPLLRSAFLWLGLPWPGSSSTQTWQERIGDLVLLGGVLVAGACTIFLSLTWWQLSLVWGACLLPSVALRRAGWLRVFGPVLYYDMIRQARRSRFIFLRLFYLLLLAFLLLNVVGGRTGWRMFATDTDEAAQIAERYFDVFMLVQFITVVLLTPAYVGGAISDEKDRKTLEFMLATDLLNREIVLSKIGSRVANLALVVLTGLPILSMLQFLGGVDPNLVLAGFAVTAMTIVGQAGVSIFCSVACKKPRESIGLAYLAVVAYYGLALLLQVLANLPALAGNEAFQLCNDLYNKGNLVMVMVGVSRAGSMGTLATALPALVRDYAIFHGAVGLVCTVLAIAFVRQLALKQSSGTASSGRKRFRLWRRPRVGLNPMMWKEINCERARSSWLAWLIFPVLLAVTFVPTAMIIWEDSGWGNLGRQMNMWVRTCNVVVGCLTLLGVGVRASNSITNERDKQTFDTLLTTPLDSGSILGAKWIGSILNNRLGIMWMMLIWIMGLLTGGLYPVALPLVIAAWAIYAGFAAALGLWFSTVCKSSLKATLCTVSAMIGLSVGHWLLWLCCIPFVAGNYDGGQFAEHVIKAQCGILTPPFVMGFLPFSYEGLAAYPAHEWEFTVFSLVGLLVWAIGAAMLYAATGGRFRQINQRI